MFKHENSVSGLQAAGLQQLVYRSWLTAAGLQQLVCSSWFTAAGLQLLVFKQQVSTWFAAVCFRFWSANYWFHSFI